MKLNNGCWAIVCAFAVAAPAGAQTAALASTDSESGLEEITVTAQRRTEDLQHAALAIDVISPRTLELAGATRATDIAAFVPALQIGGSGNSQQSIYLRSVGAFTAQGYSDPAISFNLDGVSLARTSSLTGMFYDLARIEVLKGPQGTLYGRNATGGAINILPKAPVIGETSADVSLTLGNYAQVHPEAAVNIGVSGNSAARLAFTYTRHDAYQTDGGGAANGYAGRAQYLYQLGDNLSIRFAGDYAHDGGSDDSGTLIAIQSPFTGAITPSPLPRDVGTTDPRTNAILGNQYSFLGGRFMGPIGVTPRTDNRYWGVLSEIVWKTPIGNLTLLPAHRESDLDGATTGFTLGATTVEHDEQSSFEARLASENEGMLRWLLGAYWFHETIDAVYGFNSQTIAPFQNLNQGTLSKAGFGRLTFAPIDEFRISAGIRYTSDRKSYDSQEQLLLDVCGAPTVPIPACPAAPLLPVVPSFAALSARLNLFPIIPDALYGSPLPGAEASVFPLLHKFIVGEQASTRTTYHAGVEYDLGKHSLLYASWDTGYHAGGLAFANIKPNYAPEYLTAYSVGSKNRFLGEKLELNAEVFYWKYTNQQIAHGATDFDGSYVFVTDNAGSSTIKGTEFSAKYLITPHTVLDFDAQYLSAVYTSFTYQTPAGGTNAPPVTTCPFAQTDATHYTVNCAGKTAQQAPRWSGNIGLQQRADAGDYSLFGEVSVHAQSDSVTGFELIPEEVQKSYAIVNLSAGLSPQNAKWSVVAFVNNLTDRRPYGISYYNSLASVFGASLGAPRTEGVRIDVKL
jgi:iron complex outermembrane recepter protein